MWVSLLPAGFVSEKGIGVLVAELIGRSGVSDTVIPIRCGAGTDSCGSDACAGVTGGELLEGLAPGLDCAVHSLRVSSWSHARKSEA